jgi:hypothetical protein
VVNGTGIGVLFAGCACGVGKSENSLTFVRGVRKKRDEQKKNRTRRQISPLIVQKGTQARTGWVPPLRIHWAEMP